VGSTGLHLLASSKEVHARRFSTGASFGRVHAVTSVTVDLVAKSLRGPCKVHFCREKMDISVFQQGCLSSVSDAFASGRAVPY
jgi:hypothetical protein